MDIIASLRASIWECVQSLPELRHSVTRKTDFSPVTQADYLLDHQIAETIKIYYPEVTIVSEERKLPENSLQTGWVAVVDPLDGTENFVADLPLWGVSISLWHDGQHSASLLLFPQLGLSLTSGDKIVMANSAISGFSSSSPATVISEHSASTGEFRVLGSAAFNLFCVATGRLKSFHNTVGANAWDILAGINLAIEQGCEVLIDDEPYRGQFLVPTGKYRVEVFNK